MQNIFGIKKNIFLRLRRCQHSIIEFTSKNNFANCGVQVLPSGGVQLPAVSGHALPPGHLGGAAAGRHHPHPDPQRHSW